MIRRQSILRGPGGHPFIRPQARLTHAMMLRAGDPIPGMLVKSHRDVPAHLASDLFEFTETMQVSRRRHIDGVGYGSEMQLTVANGPLLKVTASDVVIENIRFVYARAIPAGTLITRPVRCSGETYNPAALSTSTTRCAIHVTGDNVTIRDCWFDGFDNAVYTTGDNTRVEGTYFKGGTNSTLSAVYLGGSYGHVSGCYVDSTAYGVYVAGNYSSVSGNTILATESGVFVTSDMNRIHGNHCNGHSDGFGVTLTTTGQSNTLTGNVCRQGTYYFTTGQGNQYGANIGTVDLE